MGRFQAFLFYFVLIAAPAASAQVIECPGALPGAHLERAQTKALAGRLLGRFSAALGLHGLKVADEALFNEEAILEDYTDRPDQLLAKLTYLTLQCQLMLLDSDMAPNDRRRAVRRVFLEYVLQPAAPSSDDLEAYVNGVASDGAPVEKPAGIDAEIERIERESMLSDRHQWRGDWYREPAAPTVGEAPQRLSVIVASPRYEDEGWQRLRYFQNAWPDVHFELDGPVDLDSPHYAVVVGRGLDETGAAKLLDKVKGKKLPDDSFKWQPRAVPVGDSS